MANTQCSDQTHNFENRVEKVRQAIASYPDFPIKGVLFRDIFSAMIKPEIIQEINDLLWNLCLQDNINQIDAVLGIDSRGFLFGPALALHMHCGFIPVRKAGKLPGECIRFDYKLEYGSACIEVQKNSLKKGNRIVIVDDLLATGGTMAAACKLAEEVGATVVACIVVMELRDLKGRDKITAPMYSLIAFD